MRSIFFIEGQEHIRFVEDYIHITKNLNHKISIYSFEKIKFNDSSYSRYLKTVKKENLRQTLKSLSSDYFFTTTPGVGSFYFPKSKKVGKYIYIFHSLCSPNEVYIKNSFYYFDFIFSPNQIIAKQLEFLISKHSKIFITGYPVLNHYKRDLDKKKDIILIAPSWGKKSLITDLEFLNNLIKKLETNYVGKRIIIRPHPMQSKLIATNQIVENHFVEIDYDKDLNYLKNVSLLVTDWSGISLEYYNIHQGNIIFVDTPKKKRRNIKLKEKNYELIENKIRNIIGNVVSKTSDFSKLSFNSKPTSEIDKKYLNEIFNPRFESKNIEKIISSFNE